jgi:c-di-GMP-related signal transduction protein
VLRAYPLRLIAEKVETRKDFDRPLDRVLPSLSLSNDITDALLEHKAQLGSVLNGVKAYERRDWPTAEASLGLGEDAIQQANQSSMAWSMRTLGGLGN